MYLPQAYYTFSCLWVFEHGREPFPFLHPPGAFILRFLNPLKTYHYIKFFLSFLCHPGAFSFVHYSAYYNMLILLDRGLSAPQAVFESFWWLAWRLASWVTCRLNLSIFWVMLKVVVRYLVFRVAISVLLEINIRIKRKSRISKLYVGQEIWDLSFL